MKFNDNNVSVFNGNKLKIKIFGASHAEKIGVTLSGLEEGLTFSTTLLQAFCDRRRALNKAYSTKRIEPDKIVIEDGATILEDKAKTDGKDFTAVIYNTNQKSSDYANVVKVPRPAHADFPAWVKYGDGFDFRGGGKFSGRMTAPICIAGGICKQLLEEKGIKVFAYISQIGSVKGVSYKDIDPKVPDLSNADLTFPLIDNSFKDKMEEEIASASSNGDSVGGVIECVITGMPVGAGEFMFNSIESEISHLIFGVPAVKGIEFGKGFDLSSMNGSKANDPLYFEDGKVKTKSNNNGGINGGLANGMPITFRVVVKPTPSILKEQDTVNLVTGQNEKIIIKGRHDSCIVPRAVAVIEAVACLAVYDLL